MVLLDKFLIIVGTRKKGVGTNHRKEKPIEKVTVVLNLQSWVGFVHIALTEGNFW